MKHKNKEKEKFSRHIKKKPSQLIKIFGYEIVNGQNINMKVKLGKLFL